MFGFSSRCRYQPIYNKFSSNLKTMQETNSLHVLTEHPFILFIAGALLVGGLLLLIARFFARRESARQDHQIKDAK